MPSFDFASKVDLQTLDNAINTVSKEVTNRFDFKGSHVVIELNKKEFKVNQKFFEENVDFVQTVKVNPGAKKVSGTIEYMVCNDKQCLPPKTVAFDITL